MAEPWLCAKSDGSMSKTPTILRQAAVKLYRVVSQQAGATKMAEEK